MKEQIKLLKLIEHQEFIKDDIKIVRILKVWNDNNICDEFLDDTIGIGIEDYKQLPGGKLKEYNGELYAMWLTKGQAIILKNHLDNFIQLAETEEELNA